LFVDNRQSKIVNYSYLSATMGSTLVARRAGMYYSEHGVAHFHAVYGEHGISVEVESGKIHGEFPARALREKLSKRDLFGELMEGMAAMKRYREGKMSPIQVRATDLRTGARSPVDSEIHLRDIARGSRTGTK
jgi:hypothetical protein